MEKTLENKFFNILSSLDSIKAKIAIIGIFVYTGFRFGCYFKETQMKLEQLEEEKKEWLKTARYIDSLRNANNELQKENSLLLIKVERYSSQNIQHEREK